MSNYKYPENLIKKVESRIAHQLDGNSATIQDIEFKIKRQGLDQFSARTAYDLDCQVKTSKITGRYTQGKIVPSNEITSAIDNYLSSMKDQKSTNSLLNEKVKSLPNKGFAVDKSMLTMDSETTSFVSHEKCINCQGKGKNDCVPCRVTGRQNCVPCQSTGLIQCMVCRGQRQININGEMKPCHQCQGRGQSICTYCNGQRSIMCPNCQGKAQLMCKGCDGKGDISTIHTVTAKAVTKAQINIQELNADSKRMVSIVSPLNLAKGGHIKVEITKPPADEEDNSAWYEDQKIIDKSGVFYIARVPWAVGEVTYKNKPYNINIIGEKGAVAESANFMDHVLNPLINLLNNAAKSGEQPMSILDKACTYRVSRETIQSLKKQSAKKTMILLSRTYGLGLSKKSIQSIVKNIQNTMKRATQKYHHMGYVVGFVLTISILGIWFTQIRQPETTLVLDGVMTALGLACTIIGGFVGRKIGYKKLLNQIKPQ
jgi:hypothetical protein